MAALLAFSDWLSKKLQSLDTDHDVFGNYIVGILTSEETEVEKRDAVEGVLCGVINKDISELCNEIFKEWSSVQGASNSEDDKKLKDGKTDVGAKIAVIMEKQAQSVVKESLLTAEEKEMRDAILAHYSHVSDEDDYCSDKDDERGVAANTVPSNSTMAKNVNSEAVAQAEKEKREKAKAESEKKKAQDKLNREKQKQQQQERKEKEKRRTQKGERKR